MNAGLGSVKKEVSLRLAGLLDRSKSIRSFLNRNVVEQYRNVQKRRWMTENQSEGKRWKPLEPGYAEAKQKRYAKYDHGGTQMLYASGQLFKSVIGPGHGFRKIVTERQLIITVAVEPESGKPRKKFTPYAEYVDEDRSFTTYSRSTIREFNRMIYDYIVHNKLRKHTNA